MKIVATAEIDFVPYKSKKLNQKANSQIKRWIVENLRNEASFVNLSIEAPHDDATKHIKWKVTAMP